MKIVSKISVEAVVVITKIVVVWIFVVLAGPAMWAVVTVIPMPIV
jgi:hypothetical protein